MPPIPLARAAVLAAALVAAAPASRAAAYVPPPIMPVPNAWQGRSQAVLRVLDKLDAHVETLTLKAGETGSYKSLSVTVRSCMDRPDGLPRDNGAFLDIQDHRAAEVAPFNGWTFSGNPSVGVFESPVYAVQLVTCQGDLVAPAAPPLPPPVPPPASMLPPPPPPAPPADADDGAADAPVIVTPQQPAAPGASPGDGEPPPPDQPAQPDDQAAQPDAQAAQPDAVYPDGVPPPVPPPGPPPGPPPAPSASPPPQ